MTSLHPFISSVSIFSLFIDYSKALIDLFVIVTIPNKLKRFKFDRYFEIPSTTALSVNVIHHDYKLYK